MKEFYPEGLLNDTGENKKYMISPSSLTAAAENGIVLEAKVAMCDSEHNLILNLGCMRGIIPRNEGAIGIEDGSTRDIALISRVGRPVCFKVIDIRSDSSGRPYALLSRKAAQQECREWILSNRICGDIINARVTHLESFGVFCDIGCGNVALLPIDWISVSRISHPCDRFRIGDSIKVVIKDISPEGRITLSHRELLGTWDENVRMFSQGQTVTGIIRSVEQYGAFVELAPNLAGLAEPKSDLLVGRQASVYIKSIIREKMKIKLIIIDVFDSDFNPSVNYFIDSDHISEWKYSPDECSKNIFTRFY